MARVCPICNALVTIDPLCPVCGSRMADGGALENYWGPYSPYMDAETLQNGRPDSQCVHLLYCPYCHYDYRAAWELVIV